MLKSNFHIGLLIWALGFGWFFCFGGFLVFVGFFGVFLLDCFFGGFFKDTKTWWKILKSTHPINSSFYKQNFVLSNLMHVYSDRLTLKGEPV